MIKKDKRLIKKSPSEFVALINESIKKDINKKYGKLMKQYMKFKFEFYGLKKPKRDIRYKAITTKYTPHPLNRATMHEMLRKCYEYEHREMQYTAFDLLDTYWLKKLNEEDLDILEELICQKSHWDSTDTMSKYFGIIMKNLEKEARAVYVDAWLEHENMWMRRISLIYQLRYKDEIDLDVVFKNVKALMDEDEFFIQKAIGWILREAGKFMTAEILYFVKQNEDDLSHLAKVEAMRYLLARKDTKRFKKFKIPNYKNKSKKKSNKAKEGKKGGSKAAKKKQGK